MSSIQVTSPLDTAVATLALHTCTSCGRHVWEREGAELDRAAVLDVVKHRVAEGPAPRIPRPRKPRASRARVVDLT